MTRKSGMSIMGCFMGMSSRILVLCVCILLPGVLHVAHAQESQEAYIAVNHIFTWSPDQGMRDLGYVGDRVTAFNENGQILFGGYGLGTESVYRTYACEFDGSSQLTIPSIGGAVFGEAMNDSRVIVGGAEMDGYVQHPFVWDNTQTLHMPALGPYEEYATGLDVNNVGQMVGLSCLPGSFHATLWRKGAGAWDHAEMIDMGIGASHSSATLINDAGVAAGWVTYTSDFQRDRVAVLFEPQPDGTVVRTHLSTTLDPSIYSTEPVAMNNSGQIAGVVEYQPVGSGGGRRNMFFWDPEVGFVNTHLLGTSYEPEDINESGQVIMNSDEGVAMLWEYGEPVVVLPTLGGETFVKDINNLGQMVGSSRASDGRMHAVFWDSDRSLHSLGFLQDDIQEMFFGVPIDEPVMGSGQALHVNDAGQVVGMSLAGTWITIPEPAALSLLALGTLTLIRRRRMA